MDIWLLIQFRLNRKNTYLKNFILKNKITIFKVLGGVVLLLVGLIPVVHVSTSSAREMRVLKRIINASRYQKMPEGAQRISQKEPIDSAIISESVEQITKTWNSPQFSKMVSEKFFDRDKLSDAMAETSRYNTTLRLEGLGNIQVLDQYSMALPNGDRLKVSKVSVIVRTMNEFEDSDAGKVTTRGTNEIIFEIREKIK